MKGRMYKRLLCGSILVAESLFAVGEVWYFVDYNPGMFLSSGLFLELQLLFMIPASLWIWYVFLRADLDDIEEIFSRRGRK